MVKWSVKQITQLNKSLLVPFVYKLTPVIQVIKKRKLMPFSLGFNIETQVCRRSGEACTIIDIACSFSLQRHLPNKLITGSGISS